MRVRTLCLLTGIAVPLILTGSAQAGFTGIFTASKPNPWGLHTINVYAEFDRPDPGDGSGDHLVAVIGTPDSPLIIEVIGGTFYNTAFNGDQAPQYFFPAFPSVFFDTFVTIGVKRVEGGWQPFDELTILPGFPTGITGSALATTSSGWSVLPTSAQGDPFDPVWFAGDGRVLIGQFSTLGGSAIQGTMLLQFISNGVAGEAVVSFLHVIPGPGCLPALALGAMAMQRRRVGRASR